ncbi:hypothetical protein HHI36_002270 [Cryptolaemus montrouzieri]|uniref:Uncharacterized protein n=1 Tax=Cryptolaemus montrouzieri TaxID=559131 RepID=A0ABD2P9Y2_9CUCU
MDSLKKSIFLIEKSQFVLALEYYIEYFNTTPENTWHPNAVNSMILLLNSFEMFLNYRESLEDLTKCFLYALNWFPQNVKVHYLFGRMLLRNGEFTLADNYLKKATELIDNNLENILNIEKNSLYVAWNHVPRWNYRWLNSTSMNNAYKEAIRKAIEEGFQHVLNVRSGCEHLSLYAGSNSSCSSVLSLESNYILQKYGKYLMAKYCPNVLYAPLLISLEDISVPSFMMETRNLFVTDMFDSSFFGYGILEALHHSFRVLMKKEKFKLIPARVRLYLTGIDSSDLYRRYRYENDIPIIKLVDDCVTRIYDGFNYDSEIYQWYKYKTLTETIEFMDINLYDIENVTQLMMGSWCNEVPLLAIAEGNLNCLLVCYEIYLDDEIVISNAFDKLDLEVCNEQAVHYLRHPIEIKSGDVIVFKAMMTGEHLKFTLRNEEQMVANQYRDCFLLTEEAIIFLNDKKWVKCLLDLCDKVSDETKSYIADFCSFPLAGLVLAKRGHQVYYFYTDNRNLKFVEHLIRKNEIDIRLIKFIAYYQYPNFISNLKRLDYVVFEPVHQDGSLRNCPMENVAFRNMKCKVFFENLEVHFVLVYSKCLKYFNTVDEKNVEPFVDLATCLNKYSFV